MTRPGRQPVSANWQTWLVLIGTVAVGRWLAGGGFGYTLFVVLWGPVACLSIVPVRSTRRSIAIALAVIFISSLPWVSGRPMISLLHLVGWLTLFAVANLAGRRMLSSVGPSASGAVTLFWLSWVVVPLLMADRLTGCVGDRPTAFILGLNPLLIVNSADATAGDWTHQNVAYSTLTRLGQDIPFDWPGRRAGIFYAAIAIVAGIVPRGTMGRRHHSAAVTREVASDRA